MITTNALTKRFGSVVAVDEVSLTVGAGSRYGLLGPNGSGKTTLIRLLLGLIYATKGGIEIMGRPVPKRLGEILPAVGALVEGPAGYGHLSGPTNLALFDAAGAGGPRRTRRARIGAALERVGLAGVDSRPIKAYSLGMRQRLGLAAALLRAPQLLVLDEPTNGLDPQGIREIRELLRELNTEGTTVLLSSHLLGEVEQLCTHVGVMDQGKLVLQSELGGLFTPTGRVIVRTPDVEKAVGLLDGQIEERSGDRLLIRYADAAELNTRLVGQGLRVAEIMPERRSFEEVVLSVTAHGSDRVDR